VSTTLKENTVCCMVILNFNTFAPINELGLLQVPCADYCSGVRSFKALKLEFLLVIFKDSVPTHCTVIKVSWLMLFKDMIAVYSENYTKCVDTVCGKIAKIFNVLASGIYSYHCALKGHTAF
jgi:hypothetical protein